MVRSIYLKLVVFLLILAHEFLKNQWYDLYFLFLGLQPSYILVLPGLSWIGLVQGSEIVPIIFIDK